MHFNLSLVGSVRPTNRALAVPVPRILEEVLQTELYQTRCDRGLRNNAEICRPECRAWIGELRVVKGIVKFHAERKDCVFLDTSHCRRFAKGEIRIELSWSAYDTLPRIAVSR